MASLIETIIDVLNKENDEYQELIKLSTEKTPIIIKGDLDGLAKITDKEQVIVARIQKYEKTRMQTMKDISEVTNMGTEDLKLTNLIDMMASRPAEQGKLREVHDKLKVTMDAMVKVNQQNQELLKNSLEMIEFEMNLVQSARRAPETADYNKNAYSSGMIMGSGTKVFDSKS